MRFFLNFLVMVGIILVMTSVGAYALRNNGLPDLLSEWLPQFFDKEGHLPQPEDTLQAPFGDPDVLTTQATDNALNIPYDPMTPKDFETTLADPHRTANEIAKWLIKAVSEILSLEAEKYQDHMKHLATGMDEFALQDYNQFMQSSNILGTLQANNLKLHSYVEETPLLLNSGEMEGRYRWLFEMPVTLSFLPVNMDDYKDLGQKEIPNEYIMLKVQVGRADEGMEGVLIETWEVRRNTKKKKR